MFLLSLAVLAGITGLVSGLSVVGNGSQFDYSRKDLFNGKVNALLYVWVCISTILSMVHLMLISGYIFGSDQTTSDAEFVEATVANIGFGVAFTASHLFIKRQLLNKGLGEKFLWGRHVAS